MTYEAAETARDSILDALNASDVWGNTVGIDKVGHGYVAVVSGPNLDAAVAALSETYNVERRSDWSAIVRAR